jgi:guanylate kinase
MLRSRSAEPAGGHDARYGSPSVLLFCGPSGIGKSTLISRLMVEFPGKFGFSVSHTTRQARVGEMNGVHYHYTDQERMKADIAQGMFLEHAIVHGNFYGTSFAAINAVRDNGLICILDIDVQGVENIKKSPKINQEDVVFVMLVPPSIEELEKRLRNRNTDSEDVIVRRVARAREELEWRNKNNYWDAILVNDDLEQCYLELVKLVENFFNLRRPNTQSNIGHFSVRKQH